MGLPYICPYNVNSIMNPMLVACLGLGYFFNLYRGEAAGARGRRAHPVAPDALGVPPGTSPELHRLLRRGARRSRPTPSRSSATRRLTPQTPGTCTSTGRATRTTGSIRSTCGTGARTRLQHLGGVIVVGGDRAAVRRLGFKPASTLADALEMAEDVVGREPTITHLHAPPILLAEVR